MIRMFMVAQPRRVGKRLWCYRRLRRLTIRRHKKHHENNRKEIVLHSMLEK